MLLVFVSGINQTQTYGGCVTVSALIHYFTLVTWMWMGAEAVLMFQKLVIVFFHITTRYIIAVSFVCWCKYKLNCTSAWDTKSYPYIFHYSGTYCSSSRSTGNWSKLHGHIFTKQYYQYCWNYWHGPNSIVRTRSQKQYCLLLLNSAMYVIHNYLFSSAASLVHPVSSLVPSWDPSLPSFSSMPSYLL